MTSLSSTSLDSKVIDISWKVFILGYLIFVLVHFFFDEVFRPIRGVDVFEMLQWYMGYGASALIITGIPIFLFRLNLPKKKIIIASAVLTAFQLLITFCHLSSLWRKCQTSLLSGTTRRCALPHTSGVSSHGPSRLPCVERHADCSCLQLYQAACFSNGFSSWGLSKATRTPCSAHVYWILSRCGLGHHEWRSSFLACNNAVWNYSVLAACRPHSHRFYSQLLCIFSLREWLQE